jgi:hypothetical protein
LVSAASGRYRWSAAAPTLVLLQVVLVLQAALDLIGFLRGHRPAESATHLAYLIASLLVLPAAATQVARDDGPWAAVLLVVALLVVAVVVVRMQTTWRVTSGG